MPPDELLWINRYPPSGPIKPWPVSTPPVFKLTNNPLPVVGQSSFACLARAITSSATLPEIGE